MAGKAAEAANSMFASIGAIQTLVENFPMNLISYKNFQFSTSFDVITILFKMLGIDRDELIEGLTKLLVGDKTSGKNDGKGFIAGLEDAVKLAIEANIAKTLNCSTNPIISNKFLDSYYKFTGEHQVLESGEGIVLNVADVDFTGVLNRNPFISPDNNFYFDVEDYNANTVWKSQDFNAFLWYIVNKSDKSQDEERVWTNRYKGSWGNLDKTAGDGTREIIRCTYIDEKYPNTDKIKIQICGARPKTDDETIYQPANYFKTRKLFKQKPNDATDDNTTNVTSLPNIKNEGYKYLIYQKNYYIWNEKNGKYEKTTSEWALNKTIYEFNHHFLRSIKLYHPQQIIAEMVTLLLGEGNLSLNLGFSLNEDIIKAKINEIITKIIETDDMDVSDCYFSFSNDEYNKMLEEAERHRYNVIHNNGKYVETDSEAILKNLTGITSSSTLNEDIETIKKTLTTVSGTVGETGSGSLSLDLSYNWGSELIRMFIYPLVRPLFSPKVLFLLLVNKKIMGGLEDYENLSWDDLLSALFNIIAEVVIQIKNLLLEMFLDWILKELSPLLSLFASRILLEMLKMYKDILTEILSACSLSIWNISNFDFGNNGNIYGDVNYADIVPNAVQTEPGQKAC